MIPLEINPGAVPWITVGRDHSTHALLQSHHKSCTDALTFKN